MMNVNTASPILYSGIPVNEQLMQINTIGWRLIAVIPTSLPAISIFENHARQIPLMYRPLFHLIPTGSFF